MKRFPSLRMSQMLLIAVIGLLTMGAGGCVNKPKQLGEIPAEALLEFTGVIKWIDLEGGFWGILRDESDAKYRPINLPKEYQVDGLRVRITCQRIQGGISIYQWGKEIRIFTIESLKQTPENAMHNSRNGGSATS